MKEELKQIVLDIHRGEYLADALHRQEKSNIPTHVILNKMLPGLGATHAELVSERNSIIIEPNVPAIVKKKEKHPHILGIYRGVTVDHIISYLNKHAHRRKLVTTPEGFAKIKSAMKELEMDMYAEFFILFDECEKITQDIDYRQAIELPMKDFFLFHHGAFVSATPLSPSDPRFAQHGFRRLLIRPDYEYRKPLHLITTNNIVMTLTDLLNTARRKQFIFINSIDTIDSIYKDLNAQDKVATYCSQQSMEKLYDRPHRKAYDEIKNFQRINFLTGRFYSAVDIDLDDQPDVVLITDLFGAEQSIIDPNTEAIQIAGRFRNGVHSITHITSIRPDLECRTEEEAEAWLQGAERVYREMKERAPKTRNAGERDMLLEASATMTFARFINENGIRNYFLTDNFIEHEKVRNLYRDADSLLQAYEHCGFFKVSHTERIYEVSDRTRLALHRQETMKSRRKFLLEQFEKLQPLRFSTDKEEQDRYKQCVDHLLSTKDDLLFYECYRQLGKAFIEEVDFSPAKIRKAAEQNSPRLINMEAEIKTMVRKAFKKGEVYSRNDISTVLASIYNKVGKPVNKRVNATEIRKYISVAECDVHGLRQLRIC